MKIGSYQQPKRRGKKIFSKPAAAVLLVVFILAFLHISSSGALGGPLRSIARPVWSGENQISTSLKIFFTSLLDKQRLVKENLSLKGRLQRAQTIEFKNEVLEEENKTLKELLGRTSFDKLVLAPVLRRPPATLYDTLIVDIGGNTGVRSGNRVVVDGTVVIGTISRLDGKTALVTLFSTPGTKTDVRIGTSTSALAEGQGSGNFIIRLPRELNVKIGDAVTFPGISPLLFGIVASVDSKSTDPFETIRFQNPVNINALQWVEIMIDDEEAPRDSFDIESDSSNEEEEI